MKSIANQYRDLKEGKMSQANFMRNLRMTMPQFVNILKLILHFPQILSIDKPVLVLEVLVKKNMAMLKF